MKKHLIFRLSLFGLAMAIATVSWMPSNVEPVFWIIIFLICAWIIAKKCTSRYFLHGMLVSLVNCVWVTGAHVLFSDTYLLHHPKEAAMMTQMPIPDSPKLMMLMAGPSVGIVSGLFFGLFAFLAAKLVKKPNYESVKTTEKK